MISESSAPVKPARKSCTELKLARQEQPGGARDREGDVVARRQQRSGGLVLDQLQQRGERRDPRGEADLEGGVPEEARVPVEPHPPVATDRLLRLDAGKHAAPRRGVQHRRRDELALHILRSDRRSAV